MGKVAFLFAGQGAQRVGMGVDLMGASVAARETLAFADAATGGLLTDVAFAGPQEALDDTRAAQPALFAVDVAAAEALIAMGVRPEGVAGFSLGEYAAHVIAGTVSLKDAIALVRARAGFMADAAEAHPGKMAVLLRGTEEDARAVCAEASSVGIVEAVNFNSPGQVVVSGESAAVDRAVELWKERGFRPLPLATSGPFHSSLMKDAADQLLPLLQSTAFLEPAIPLYTNADAAPLAPATQAASLYRQVSSPVLWEQTMRAMIADGFDTFVECGPGGVLCGLLSRIDQTVACYRVEDADSLDATFRALTERNDNG